MAFYLLEYLRFFVTEVFRFLHYANEESDDVIGGFAKTVQHSIKNISSSVLQTGHQKCTSQKKENDTCRVTAMTTVMPLVLF